MIRFFKNFSKPVKFVDPYLGYGFAFEVPTYSNDVNLVDSGTGPILASEWSHIRKTGNKILYGTDGTEHDNDENHFKYLLTIEEKKLFSVLKFADKFNFERYNSILELGCGSMLAAFVIKNKFPHLRIMATDVDPYLIEKLSGLTLLSKLEKGVIDINKINPEILKEFDLLTTWGLEYAVSDDQLLKLLNYVKNFSIPYLMCTPSIVGPIGYLRNFIFSKSNEVEVSQRTLRPVGRHRSLGAIRKLSRKANLNMKLLGWSGHYFCILFEP